MLIVRSVNAGVVPYLIDGRHPGRWSQGADRLLGLSGPVERTQLRRLLDGRDPRTGTDLPLRRLSGRRAGWGLVFSAPKSVSLLATVDPEVATAQVAAVEQVIGYLESRLRLNRVDRDGRALEADGLLAASFDHTTNAASEPHLHTHVVVANASRSGDLWGAVQPVDWNVERGALAALFELELRHQMGQRGWPLDWRLRPDGLADVADVPRTAVRAASVQGRRAAMTGRLAARKAATPQPWEARAAAAGFVAPSPALPQPGLARSSMDDPSLERAVGLRLASRRSDFRRAAVIETLAACWPGGASVDEATAWADRFCARSLPVASPTSQPRWATDAARRLDQQLLRELTERAPEAGQGIHFMGCLAGRTDLLAQAEMIAAARDGWEEAGLRVAVDTADSVSEARWGVLTGLPAWRPGHPADVVVVDRADRRPSADLLRLVRSHDGELVFVEGGTLPRLTNPASHGLVDAADRLGRVICDPHEPWGSSPDRDPSRDLGRDLGVGPLVGRGAADSLLRDWRAAGDGSVLVALGIEEIRALNRAAVGTSRAAQGPARFEPGDRVVVLKSGPGLPPFGTLGTVSEGSGPAGDAVGFDWQDGGRTTTADRRLLASVDFGYAVSPRVAAGTSLPLRLFGPAEALGPGRGRERVVASIEKAADGLGRGREPGGRGEWVLEAGL